MRASTLRLVGSILGFVVAATAITIYSCKEDAESRKVTEQAVRLIEDPVGTVGTDGVACIRLEGVEITHINFVGYKDGVGSRIPTKRNAEGALCADFTGYERVRVENDVCTDGPVCDLGDDSPHIMY